MQVYTSYPNLSWVIPIYETYTGISRVQVILICPSPGVVFPDVVLVGNDIELDAVGPLFEPYR